MADQDRVVQAARSWIGTPYCHQASRRGAGTDCLGLVRGIWREIIGEEPEAVPVYSMDWSEPQGEERLWIAAGRHLIRCSMVRSELEPGDVVLFRMRSGSVAKHLGVVSEAGTCPRFVHAYAGYGVVESPLSAPWKRRIVARFKFPREEQ